VSHGQQNSAHAYEGRRGRSRGARLTSKLGRAITLGRLDELLGRKEAAMRHDDPKPDPAPDDQQGETPQS
jgi:hypothetical protein